MAYTADEIIEKLGMEEHYEGGYYKFIWKSDQRIPQQFLPQPFTGDRKSCSVIYYLLKPGQVSCWHKLSADEFWFWHCGGTLEMTLAQGKDHVEHEVGKQRIGFNLDQGENLQVHVPSGLWQTTTPIGDNFVLVSCAVSPGFENDDFYLEKAEGKGD